MNVNGKGGQVRVSGQRKQRDEGMQARTHAPRARERACMQ
eukprot:CAMPEP_0175665684 /NCGR_PEP_ID=MMETSP0097-20121207/17187_1 /TAXON_ID=311494 /ORGANISM="Alexandrium monilatum, Strain CCMP3105" /LENGTH=39 /DNA_ID= /DNA_START= /DNA_END= /DNA_ORIENTATION=